MTALDERTTTATCCRTCGKPMRPARVTLDDAPGTVRHHGRGYCRTCHRLALNRGDIPPLEHSDQPQRRCAECNRRMPRPRQNGSPYCAICTGERGENHDAGVIEDVEWMADTGETWWGAINRLRRGEKNTPIRPETLERLLYRHGRHDLAVKLRANGEVRA